MEKLGAYYDEVVSKMSSGGETAVDWIIKIVTGSLHKKVVLMTLRDPLYHYTLTVLENTATRFGSQLKAGNQQGLGDITCVLIKSISQIIQI